MEPIITRKKIKHLYIKVTPPYGEVVVSAPKKMPDREIQEILIYRKEWIEKQQQKFLNFPKPITYKTGDILPLWGKEYRLQLQHHSSGSCHEVGETLFLSVSENSTLEERKDALDTFYRQELSAVLPLLSSHWKEVVGVDCDDFRIRKMTTRWGSCNILKKRIWVSLYLAKHPPQCLDYLLVHELCHLYEKGHNKKFWGYVTTFYPQWKEVRHLLNYGTAPEFSGK